MQPDRPKNPSRYLGWSAQLWDLDVGSRNLSDITQLWDLGLCNVLCTVIASLLIFQKVFSIFFNWKVLCLLALLIYAVQVKSLLMNKTALLEPSVDLRNGMVQVWRKCLPVLFPIMYSFCKLIILFLVKALWWSLVSFKREFVDAAFLMSVMFTSCWQLTHTMYHLPCCFNMTGGGGGGGF